MDRLAIILRAALIAATIATSTAFATGAERLSGATWRMDVSHPPGAGPFPAVILLPGCAGNTPPLVARGLRAHAKALNARGYATGILDVLGPRGLSSICADAGRLGGMVERAVRDAFDAANALAALPRIEAASLAFLGQSFGGSVALAIASRKSQPFAATVAYYPWCAGGYGASGRSDFAVPVLILAGRSDDWTPVERCSRLKPLSGTRGARIVIYEKTHHSFDLPGLGRQTIAGVGGAKTVAGNPAATADSRRRYAAFLKNAFSR
ncbi:prolyl oligopeptidase family serine peptidase [Nitratireductor mangrovi]|uniref:Prolyl oligopeptidase family serine peptidase n=1 Tax=Nitratireductor mangrovi TaxID=2599600 RepID=A0A5B8L3C7_9HYPH|nr:dienelactone hydrolase family protein [Nitratireductor mangrovi]QDZ02446.1 prolyl oligopeptidase family serine peptidase [Nitratireductor mangrovi]